MGKKKSHLTIFDYGFRHFCSLRAFVVLGFRLGCGLAQLFSFSFSFLKCLGASQLEKDEWLCQNIETMPMG